jgi:hypothetical protein
LVVPFIYVLLPGRTAALYKKALDIILTKIDDINPGLRRPTNIILDFEKAEENAFRELMPAAAIHGCYFHYKQCIWRNVQKVGLAARYQQAGEAEFIENLKMFAALTFVPTGF